MVDKRKPVEIVPIGAVSARSLVWQFDNSFRLTVVIKATYMIQDRKTLVRTLAQPISDSDIYRSGDPTQSLILPSELVPFKPKVDVILVGAAHTNKGIAATASSVRFALFKGQEPLFDRTIHVYGDRTKPNDEPRPFMSLPIIFERAYGGIGYHHNPVGVGADDRPLQPNLFDPVHAEEVACFGPISRYWSARRSLVDSDARKKLKHPVMDVVRDMDWNYFQAAPRAQQVPSLNGDEWLLMEGMHPELYRIQAQLPNAIAHIEVNHDNIQFSAPKLDTVSIDAEEMRCSLVWRSNAVLESDEMLRNIIMYAGARDAAQSDDHWNTVLSVARGSEPSSGLGVVTLSEGQKSDVLNETLVDNGLPPPLRDRLVGTMTTPSADSSRPQPASEDGSHKGVDMLATIAMDGPPIESNRSGWAEDNLHATLPSHHLAGDKAKAPSATPATGMVDNSFSGPMTQLSGSSSVEIREKNLSVDEFGDPTERTAEVRIVGSPAAVQEDVNLGATLVKNPLEDGGELVDELNATLIDPLEGSAPASESIPSSLDQTVVDPLGADFSLDASEE